jgi:predicted amidohydrolase
MSAFTVAGLQLALDDGDNWAAIAAEIARTLRRYPWVQMVVLPELATFGAALAHAQQLPGPAEQAYQALAVQHGIWLVTGSLYERVGTGPQARIHNTASVIDPQGRVVARHRKLYPFLPYETGVTAGERVTVFDVPGVGRFGLSICYDGWFPEVARAMAWAGAEVMLLPAMTNTIDRPQELVLAQAQAIANQCLVVNVNIAGSLGLGRSIVVGPEGQVLHEAGGQQEVFPLLLDLDHVRAVRQAGTLGLGQVLKSFRDGPRGWACYADGNGNGNAGGNGEGHSGAPSGSPSLQALGPLHMPVAGDPPVRP